MTGVGAPILGAFRCTVRAKGYGRCGGEAGCIVQVARRTCGGFPKWGERSVALPDGSQP